MRKSGFAANHLKSFIERIERLEEEKAALAADIREVYSEAKGMGFDAKIMRKVVALRKLDTADRQEQEAMLDLYKGALGMDGTPLGEYVERTESQAKAADDATHTERLGEVEGDKGTSNVADDAEAVSRLDARRSASATSEIMDVTGGESAALDNPSEEGAAYTDEAVTLDRHVNAAPPRETEMEIPAFLVRKKEREPEHA
jgi:uncharacterized protein (UPF0335 family)